VEIKGVLMEELMSEILGETGHRALVDKTALELADAGMKASKFDGYYGGLDGGEEEEEEEEKEEGEYADENGEEEEEEEEGEYADENGEGEEGGGRERTEGEKNKKKGFYQKCPCPEIYQNRPALEKFLQLCPCSFMYRRTEASRTILN
jgi:hypothetical protein